MLAALVLAMVCLGCHGALDEAPGSCQREKDALKQLGSRLEGAMQNVLTHTEQSLGMRGSDRAEAVQASDLKRILSPQGPSGGHATHAAHAQVPPPCAAREPDASCRALTSQTPRCQKSQESKELGDIDGAQDTRPYGSKSAVEHSQAVETLMKECKSLGAGLTRMTDGKLKTSNEKLQREVDALKKRLAAAEKKPGRAHGVPVGHERCYYESVNCTTGGICSHSPPPGGTGKPYGPARCASHGRRHNCKWVGGACVAQGAWDFDYETVPTSRLCRAGADFYGSKMHSALCLNIARSNNYLKSLGKSTTVQKLHPELDVCPDHVQKVIHEDWQRKSFKQKFYELPTLKFDSTQNEFSKKYPVLQLGNGAGKNAGIAVVNGVQQIVCSGRCAVPPVYKNGFMEEDAYCKCSDGISNPLYGDQADRWKQMDVITGIAFVIENFQTTMCSRVPAVGCKWCDVGFSPFDPSSWYTERLGKKYRCCDKVPRKLTNTWVKAKTNFFPKCPSWWTGADEYNSVGYVQTKFWHGGGDWYLSSKNVASKPTNHSRLGYASNDQQKCPVRNEVRDMPPKLPYPNKEEDLGEGMGLTLQDKLADAAAGGYGKLKKIKIKAPKIKIKAPRIRLPKVMGCSVKDFKCLIVKAIQDLVHKIVPKLPCLTGANKDKMTWLMDKVADNFARKKKGDWEANPVNVLKMYMFGLCEKNHYCASYGKHLPGYDNAPYRPILPDLFSNVMVCMLTVRPTLHAMTQLNKYAEPALAVQELCSKFDAMLPFTGLPRRSPLPGTFAEGKNPGWLRYRETSVPTLAIGEGPEWEGLRLFPHMAGKALPRDLSCTRNKPCSSSEVGKQRQNFMLQNKLFVPTQRKSERKECRWQRMVESPATGCFEKKKPYTHDSNGFSLRLKMNSFVNSAMGPTLLVHNVRADELWMKAFAMPTSYRGQGTARNAAASKRCSDMVKNSTGIKDGETDFNTVRDKFANLDNSCMQHRRRKKDEKKYPCDRTRLPYRGDKTRFAFIDCIHPLCESAGGRHNVVEEEIEPNKFVIMDCRNKKIKKKKNMDYVVVDGGKAEYPLQLTDRIKFCSALTTQFSRPMGLKMAPPSCLAAAEIQMNMCNTCCCKKGTIFTSMSQSLIIGGRKACGTWLAVLDWFFRTVVSVTRMINVVDKYGLRCFNKIDVDNPNTSDPEDGTSFTLKHGPGNLANTHKVTLSGHFRNDTQHKQNAMRTAARKGLKGFKGFTTQAKPVVK